MQGCIFCKIVQKKLPSYLIYEDDHVMAFLDISPASIGQTLVIPREHRTDYVFKIEDPLYTKLFATAKKIATAIDSALETQRTCMVVEGFEVSHPHIRLHPCYENHLNLKSLENKPSEEEFKKLAGQIKSLL